MLDPNDPQGPEQWIAFTGKTLREVERAAIWAAFVRCGGNRAHMMLELGIAKSTLVRHLFRMGIRRGQKPLRRGARDIEIARSFQKHRSMITTELKIPDRRLMEWLESRIADLVGGSR